ncbi:uncharacterized protein UTRI_04279 [Ustilago trichophora]|uniref:Uncharacterized protein n=1 Tax=Ustilago trichophora TaxID=86804 RepID=A0A5C3ERB5_9BASI|nr:uncharacterized protein UTRI_04279 [Ustilago trichophora]
MQQPIQHIPINLGQASGGMDSSVHQGAHSSSALFPNGLPHSSMPSDPLTSALSLLPPELLQSHPHQHIHQSFGQLASSQAGGSASLLSHVHNQLQPGNPTMLAQQGRGPQGLPQPQQSQLPDNQQQPRQRPQQRRQLSQGQKQQQQQQQQQPQQQQQQPHSTQQGQQQPPPLRTQPNIHLNHNQHPPTSQPQQPPNLAQLLGSNPAAIGAQPSLLQQHASVLSEARSSVSNFSQSLQEAKQATPSDRGDIRSVVSLLERASKAFAAELEQGVSKLRSLSNSPAFNNVAGLFNGAGFGQGSNTAGHDLFGALNGFGMPGSAMQQQQQQQPQHNAGGMPFDLGLAFPQPPHPNGMFNLNGAGNAGGPGGPGSFNGAFPTDVGTQANGQQGVNAQNSPLLSALLAQYLSQSGDPSSRMGALSLFQSLANGSGNGPTPNSAQGLEALLNQGLPPHQQQDQQQQQQSRVGMPGMNSGRINNNQEATSVAQLANGAPLTNAAALAALTSLGITPTMLEALGLGSVAQQMLDAPAEGGNKQEGSSKLPVQMRASPGFRDESPEADHNDPSSEPARKKRKQGRAKAISASPHVTTDASSSKQPSQSADAKNVSATRAGHPVAIHSAPPKPSPSIPPVSNPNIAGSSDASKRIPTLGVGLRQEGDKRYRNRKLLRDLREHLYRWLGTDEFRKLRNTYKVAEWVPNPHLTEEEKQILASLPPGAVAQPPITTHIFHVDFTSRDFYRTNQSLIDAIVTEGSKKVEAKPEAYAIVPGTIDRDHLEDVAKDLMDSARSGFRMSLRTGLQAEKEDKEKHEKYRGVERAKTKCRNREIGAGRLRHAIPKQLLIPGAYSDDAASDEDLHGLTKSEWKRQRLRKLRIAKGWEAVTPKWRNKHLTRAYHKADIVSKSKQMARWRRDDPVDLPIPIKLYGKMLPKQLFDPDWLAEHRKELEDEPYCIRINDNDIDGWDEGHHPLGEDTSDEMEWSDAKESHHNRGRQLMSSAPSSSRERGSTTQSPVPSGSGSASLKAVDLEGKNGSATPIPTSARRLAKDSPDTASLTHVVAPEDAKPKPSTGGSEGSGTSSVSGSSRSGHPDAGSDSESDTSVGDKVTITTATTTAATATATATATADTAAKSPSTVTVNGPAESRTSNS